MSAAREEPTVLLEIDDEGTSSGLELEDIEGRIATPFDPERIDVVGRTMTADLLIARLRRGVLDLNPDFQRMSGIWNATKQSRLIESMLLRIPLPTLYAAEHDEETWVVVDGVQRLSTIARFMAPETLEGPALRLVNLEYLRDYEDYSFDDLPGRLRTRLQETELNVNLIRIGTPEPVMFNIFSRINTGGAPLTQQELRHALIPGRTRDLLAELAKSEAFLNATTGSVSPRRMADREMILRYLAFRLLGPDRYMEGDLDEYLRKAMRDINRISDDDASTLRQDFALAMRRSQEVFGEHAFRKVFHGQRGRLVINKALFEAEAVGLAVMSEREASVLAQRREAVLEGLIDLLGDSAFFQAVSVGTGDVSKVRYRFAEIERLYRKVIG